MDLDRNAVVLVIVLLLVLLICGGRHAFGANNLAGNPLAVDTAHASNVIGGNRVIKRIRWVGCSTAAHSAVIHTAAGRTLWTATCEAAHAEIESTIGLIWGPFIVPTLASGTLYIYLDEGQP